MTNEQLAAKLDAIDLKLTKMLIRVDEYGVGLSEFAERFEEVMLALEDERRLDLMQDFE